MPGRHLLRLAVPRLARAVNPGQFVHVTSPRPRGLLLPALPVAGFDRVAGSVSLLIDANSGGRAGLLGLRDGEMCMLDGPLGRGFEIDARSRYLLLVADADGFARVRASVDAAVATGRQVAVLVGARTVAEVFPSSMLPDEAEYVVATADGSLGHRGEITDLVTDYEAWADQCFAAGTDEMVATMAALAKGRDDRMGVARLGRRRGRRPAASEAIARRRAWLQVAMRHDAGCALGLCLGCVTTGTDGPLRACREGPAFAAAELRWEPRT